MERIPLYFIFPPGIFILGFFLIAFLCRKSKTVYILSTTLGTALYLLSIEPVKDLLYNPLEKAYPVPKRWDADAIVVLGGGSYNTGVLKEDSLKRILAGFVLHKESSKPIILSGGSEVNNLPDAEIMKSFLESLGVDRKKILTETQSTSTRENAKFIKRVMDKHGYKSILLVTSAYHMKRAVKSFQRENIQVIPYPTDFKRDGRYNLYSLMPKMSTLNDSYKAIREYIAYIVYDVMD